MNNIYFFGGPHPINETYILNPPEGFSIKSNLSLDSFKTVSEYTMTHENIKKIYSSILDILKLPRMIYIPTNCDLIHTSGGIIPLNRKPYVIKIEHASSFFNLDDDKLYNEDWKNSLVKKLSNNYCKKILPYSEATKRSFQNALGSKLYNKITDKVEVLYPAIDTNISISNKGKNDNDFFKILFISRHFFDDGGRELVEACKILGRRYDIKLYMITNPPEHHLAIFKEYTKKIKNDNISIITEKFPRDILFRNYYSQADLFVIPSYIHFFGYVILEAMAFKLPIITTDVYAMPEIVEDNKNGFVIKTPISCFNKELLKPKNHVSNYNKQIVKDMNISKVSEQLIDKISLLIEDEYLRKKMSVESFKIVESGKFSIKERNKKLKRIYEEALEF